MVVSLLVRFGMVPSAMTNKARSLSHCLLHQLSSTSQTRSTQPPLLRPTQVQMFLVGLLAALLGNCVIGVGQALQKYALNRIHPSATLSPPSHRRKSKSSPTSTAKSLSSLFQPSAVSSSSSSSSTSLHRVQSPYWLLGMAMTYLGELCGNWVGLAYASAAVVAPLGVVSVVVSAVLAQRWLKEDISRRQREAFGWMLIGVLLILVAAPRGASGGGGGSGGATTPIMSTATATTTTTNTATSSASLTVYSIASPADWLQFMTVSPFSWMIFALLVAAALLLYQILVRRQESLESMAAVTSIFGAMTALASKAFAVYARVWPG